MSKKQIIDKLSKLEFENKSSLINEVSLHGNSRDVLYNASLLIFQSSTIDHKKRLSLLKTVYQISQKYNIIFCAAHSLTLIIKVSREIGLQNNLIKDSHKAIELWKSVLNESLAINGLIFTYTDLALVFSDFDLNSLALKYLDKANSLISECENTYNVSTKLYVAYAVVFAAIKNSKKSNIFYEKVISLASSKKDTLTQIPVFINISNELIEKKNFIEAENYLQKALKYSKINKERIYRPYIYFSLSKISLDNNNYKQSINHLNKSLGLFKEMNSFKMVPQIFYYHGLISFKQKKYNDALEIFDTVLSENKKINDYDLDIRTLKKQLIIYKETKNRPLYLVTMSSLNKFLEKKIKTKEKIFSDTNANALKHLSKEFDLSLINQKNIALKLNIQSTKRKLTTKALISVSEREFLNKIIEELLTDKINNRKIIQLCKIRLQHTKDWNVFMKLFNDINPQFNQYIVNKCPFITESELRVCNLIKMSFSSSEIADIISITKRGVEQHRYRIKKKLNLETDLTIFIQSI